MVRLIKNIVFFRKLKHYFKKIQIKIIGEEKYESKIYLEKIGERPDFLSPVGLNEKIAWLKIHYYKDIFKICCDKYLLHEYLISKFGKDYAPELIFCTRDPRELNFNNISYFPCIIKVSNGSGANLIVRNKEQYTERFLQKFFKKQVWVSNTHALTSLEHQYVTSKPYIVVEKLLTDENGDIPNDYKFLYINGKLEFIYCSVDRTGANVRHIYDSAWNRLNFTWVAGADEQIHNRYMESKSIMPPRYFEEMKKMSYDIAKDFPLVRVDFYETNNDIYIGEITLHHGSGHDRFYPKEFDKIYGDKLILPEKNR